MRTNTRGFTLVELMVATTVFSIIMLMCATAILQIGKIYSKGLNQIKAQETTRAITEEITRAIQFSNVDVQLNPPGTICIGRDRYSYVTNIKLSRSAQKHVLWADGRIGVTTCPAITGSLATTDNPSASDPNYEPGYITRELLSENMSLLDFQVVGLGPPPIRTYRVSVVIGVGDIDYIDIPSKTCKQGDGSEFCAISSLTTVVSRRLQ